MPLINLLDFSDDGIENGLLQIPDVVFWVVIVVVVIAIIGGFILKGFLSELKKK